MIEIKDKTGKVIRSGKNKSVITRHAKEVGVYIVEAWWREGGGVPCADSVFHFADNTLACVSWMSLTDVEDFIERQRSWKDTGLKLQVGTWRRKFYKAPDECLLQNKEVKPA